MSRLYAEAQAMAICRMATTSISTTVIISLRLGISAMAIRVMRMKVLPADPAGIRPITNEPRIAMKTSVDTTMEPGLRTMMATSQALSTEAISNQPLGC